MVHDQQSRFRAPCWQDKAMLRGIPGDEVLAAWSEETQSWRLNGVEVKVVAIRHRPGRFDHVKPGVFQYGTHVLINGQLHGAIERPWYLRSALAQSGRLVVNSKEQLEQLRDDQVMAYRDSLIRDGLLIPKELL
jgi:hypothetical protein